MNDDYESILDDDFICGDCLDVIRTVEDGHYKYTCSHINKVVDKDTLHPKCPYLNE